MTQHNEKQVCNIFISSRGSQAKVGASKVLTPKKRAKAKPFDALLCGDWTTFLLREHDMRPKCKFLLEKFHFWKRSRKKYITTTSTNNCKFIFYVVIFAYHRICATKTILHASNFNDIQLPWRWFLFSWVLGVKIGDCCYNYILHTNYCAL